MLNFKPRETAKGITKPSDVSTQNSLSGSAIGPLQESLGMKAYVHLHFLVETDLASGETRCVKFVSYPGTETDWLVKNYKRSMPKKVQKKLMPKSTESEEEVI